MSEVNVLSSDVENLSHKDVLKTAKELLSSMLNDPFLSDVSVDDSVKDVNSILALAQGKAISIHIKKYDGEIICTLH